MNLKNKKILVTGGTGMIGQQLIPLLLKEEAKVKVISLDDPSLAPENVEFVKGDLTDFNVCKDICKNVDIVFNLIGIKTSPKIIEKQPADIFVSFLRFNTNIIEAARQANVEWFLYTSTVGVYPPTEIMSEDDVWNGFPSKNDWYGGWGKRMGEMQLETYKIQYGLQNHSIIRPANVYGPHDDFSSTSMVIPSIIKRVVNKENPFVVWGDGSPIRDFIHAKDVARGMIFAVKNEINVPLNMGSGTGISIKELISTALEVSNFNPEVIWDSTMPSGDKKRILSMERSNKLGFFPEINLKNGLTDTINWYTLNKDNSNKRYNTLKK
jgi:GDP-L-fucose synthase